MDRHIISMRISIKTVLFVDKLPFYIKKLLRDLVTSHARPDRASTEQIPGQAGNDRMVKPGMTDGQAGNDMESEPRKTENQFHELRRPCHAGRNYLYLHDFML